MVRKPVLFPFSLEPSISPQEVDAALSYLKLWRCPEDYDLSGDQFVP